MRHVLAGLAALALLSSAPLAQTRAANALTMYVVDVEGGNATPEWIQQDVQEELAHAEIAGSQRNTSAPPARSA